ncbi:hypothetical protein DSAG12_03490 [Promethearchaeum syntrophicum]|uniref:Uncharacterized protein n=1 Tax=Promethearchaeum syntrophicum TaxID=2594042 RepID=A0A5B9DFU4_9ARCH
MEKQDKKDKKSILWLLAIIGLSFIQYLWPALLVFAIFGSIKKLVSKSQFIEKVPSKPIAQNKETKISI